MKILSRNCRGLGSSATVPQLKESLKLFKPGLVFVCETMRRRGFVETVCRKLGWGERWQYVDPVGKSGGLLLELGSEVTIHQLHSTEYSIEVEIESADTKGKMWVIFIYASIREKVRAE